MDEVVAAYPKKRLEVILDNLQHAQKERRMACRHPLVTFHYTPTRASWLNQVEGGVEQNPLAAALDVLKVQA